MKNKIPIALCASYALISCSPGSKKELLPNIVYILANDIGETNNVASLNPEIVKKMEEIMEQAHTPSEVFPFAFESSQK